MKLEKQIVAIVTQDAGKVGGCGAPVFYVSTKAEQDKVATYLSRTLEGIVHDLENGIYVIIRH